MNRFVTAAAAALVTFGCTGRVLLGEPDRDASTSDAASTCATPAGARHTYTSVADVQQAISGRWALCTGQITSPADTAGVELAGTTAYFLVRDAAGNLVRGRGFDYEQKLEIFDATQMNGPGSYQINLGNNSYYSDYSDSPRRLRLNEATTAKQADYAPAP